MRIAYVSTPWLPVPPPAYGGTETVIDGLARGVRAAGHQVMLFATGDSTCPVERRWLRRRSVPELVGQSTAELAHVIAAYSAARAWGADIVHDHTTIGPAYARDVGGVPVVTTNHGPFTEDTRAIYRDAAQHATVIAISHAQAAAAGHIPIGRVIHHGVAPTDYPVGRGAGGFLLFLGRMCPHKGVREAALVARAAAIRLLIAAKMREPAERAYFAVEVEPLLCDDVQFIGEVAAGPKVKLLGAASALLNPICWPEPFGLTMIEALACGTPVVGYARGSAPEIVDDGRTGYLSVSHEQPGASGRRRRGLGPRGLPPSGRNQVLGGPDGSRSPCPVPGRAGSIRTRCTGVPPAQDPPRSAASSRHRARCGAWRGPSRAGELVPAGVTDICPASSGVGRLGASDEFRCSLCDRQDGCLGVGRGNLGHDRGVGNTQPVDPPNAKVSIDHRHLVRPDPAATRIVEVGPQRLPAGTPNAVIVLDTRAWRRIKR